MNAVLLALAHRYERSRAGKRGGGDRDLLIPLEALLEDAGCREGERRAVAEQELRDAQARGLLRLEPVHRRDPLNIGQVRFSPAAEEALYAALGRPSPTAERRRLADQFIVAGDAEVPERWRDAWRAWCRKAAADVIAGDRTAAFDRSASAANAEVLLLLPRLLAWQGESLVRFASCLLCGDSKRLEALATLEREGEFAGQLRGRLGRLLEEVTSGAVRSLDDLGIVPNPRSVLAHGPLRLQLDGRWLDLGCLAGPYRLSAVDLGRATEINTTAVRCLTVENETSFQELAKLNSGELLVHTSYPGSGTLALLRRLTAAVQLWHFGDSDEAGFEILRVLREKVGREIRPLHMTPGRMPFEQESLGRPTLSRWPFYGAG